MHPIQKLRNFRKVNYLVPLLILSATGAFARPLECKDLPPLMRAFLHHHYAIHDLTSSVRSRGVEQMIKFLDPSKTLLLESDVNQLKGLFSDVFKEVDSGNCVKIESAYQIVFQRLKENEEYVKQFLGPNYKFDENTQLVLNPDFRSYSKTKAEREVLLSKMLHFEISNYLISGTNLDEAKRLLKKRYALMTKNALKRRPEDHLNIFAEAFAHSLDPHSDFMSQEELQDFQIEMQLSLEGIGASLTSEDGYTIIQELIPGGSADKSKMLKPKDKIVAVAQGNVGEPVSVIDMDLRDVVKLIRGKKGTIVKLSILRQGQKTEQFQVSIVRDKIDLKEQAAKITYEKKKEGEKELKIGIIDFPSFYGDGQVGGRSSYHDMKALLEKANAEKVDGIILDLSRNGGGLLDQAVKIGGLFIKRGGIVATKDTSGGLDIMEDQDPDVVYSGPLVVLTSRVSASASEILAGALKDYNRALIIGGDHTFGKGTVQVLAALPSEIGAMKVTTGMFFLPSGVSTQDLGVMSDIVLPSTLNSDQIGETKLDYSLPQGKIETFFSKDANSNEPGKHWTPIDHNLISKLRNMSLKRVTQNKKFAEIRKELEETLKNKGVVRLAEIRKKANEDKKSGNDPQGTHGVAKSNKKNIPPEDNAFLQESINVLMDMIALQKS